MFELDITAITAGVFSGLLVSFIIGGILGAAMIAGDENLEDDSNMIAQFSNPTVAVQLIILSFGTSILSGAITAWMADSALYINTGIVGIIALILGWVLPVPEGFPNSIRIISTIGTLPATLFGAWILS